MHRRMYRTYDLTRRLLAMLTKYRLKMRPLGLCYAVAAVISVHAQPVHHTVTLDLFLAYDGNIVL